MIGTEALWDMVGHAFNLVYLAAFMARERRRMRLLLIGAASLELLYFLHVAASPLWSGVIWSGAYLVYAAQGMVRDQLGGWGRFRTDP